jgi:hypothetical protein
MFPVACKVTKGHKAFRNFESKIYIQKLNELTWAILFIQLMFALSF